MVNSVEKRLQFLKLDPQDGLLFKLNVWVSRLLVSAKGNAASAIYQFLDSRLTVQKFSPCLDSNRKGSLYSLQLQSKLPVPLSLYILGGQLREVVIYKNRTTGVLFQEKFQAHLLYGR